MQLRRAASLTYAIIYSVILLNQELADYFGHWEDFGGAKKKQLFILNSALNEWTDEFVEKINLTCDWTETSLTLHLHSWIDVMWQQC